eukprot:CAMPEP_0185735250 /NCGR_PEP_ID=MMETSP1171-20130828/24688_1 /TAXON_ID=374046 /ORGANISM="Helicotheca tamensis, Strain CCMP826" /LENGTH=693 /DNA_ID=CAMNT_0028405473 /DNA_START=3 /DNA_END=2084 /DNA_ORIENTATION=+
MTSSNNNNDNWEDQFHKDIESIREGTRLYLSNDFQAAENLFREGMEHGTVKNDNDDTTNTPKEEDGTKIDLRGAFAVQFAIVGLLRGVASMEDDQLDECLSRLWKADELASNDTAWVGRKVCRGICYLMAGIVECLRKQPLQGVVHMARSWIWLRSLKTEALEYDGIGKEIVRSAALLALGAFALILSLLPDKMIKAASWTTGFDVKRSVGLDMLVTCQKEGGVYAPIAALGWIAFTVDTKAFIGEMQTEQELEKCEELFKWAEPQYQQSLFFSILEADLYASQRKLPKALGVLERSMKLKCLEELRALKAMLYYKKAIYNLAALEFEEAAKAYEASQQIYKAAGRRSLGPSMAMKAAQCYFIAGGSSSKESVERMLEEVATYEAMEKSNWPSSDRQSFREYKEYEELFGMNAAANKDESDDLLQKKKASWCLLKVSIGMVIMMRCTLWMSPDQASQFEKMLDEGGYESNPDDEALKNMCLAKMHSHQNAIEPGLSRCEAGLSLSSQVGESSHKFGTVAMLHYLVGHFNHLKGKIRLAEASLSNITEQHVTKDVVLHHYLSFKTSQLKGRIKRTIEEEYEDLNVSAGKKAVIYIEMQDSSDITVEWDWFLADRDIDFDVRFKPKSGNYESEVVPVVRKSYENGHVEGSFRLEGGKAGDVLQLTFSNAYSYLRGKVVTYKVKFPTTATKRVELN